MTMTADANDMKFSRIKHAANMAAITGGTIELGWRDAVELCEAAENATSEAVEQLEDRIEELEDELDDEATAANDDDDDDEDAEDDERVKELENELREAEHTIQSLNETIAVMRRESGEVEPEVPEKTPNTMTIDGNRCAPKSAEMSKAVHGGWVVKMKLKRASRYMSANVPQTHYIVAHVTARTQAEHAVLYLNRDEVSGFDGKAAELQSAWQVWEGPKDGVAEPRPSTDPPAVESLPPDGLVPLSKAMAPKPSRVRQRGLAMSIREVAKR